MMTSLFSSFDPCSSMPLTTNWLSSLIILLMVFSSYWICPNRYLVIFNKINMNMHSEFKNLLGPQTFGVTLMFTSILLFIMFNNFMGLYPYIFTSSSHMVVTMSLSLPLWVSFMLYGWINHTNHMFSHLVPQSTPGILMPFMVVIETVSNVIRPGTLAVRLAANMIAGHLLMTLLGNQTASVGVNLIGILLGVQIILLTLESAVAVIQSYVFAILVTLYSSEIESH